MGPDPSARRLLLSQGPASVLLQGGSCNRSRRSLCRLVETRITLRIVHNLQVVTTASGCTWRLVLQASGICAVYFRRSILVKERRASLVPSPLKSNALESNSAIATMSCVAGPASKPGLHARVSSWRRGREWCKVLGSEALWGQARRPPPVVVSRSCFGSATGMPAPLL